MKCSLCEKEAVREIPYMKLFLCREHFIDWFNQRFIRDAKRYKLFEKSKRVAVAVSGGKDSTTMLHLLNEVSKQLNIEIIGVTIDLGINNGTKYSSKSVEIAINNFKIAQVEYKVIDLNKDYNFTIDRAKSRTNRPACSVCGLSKRYILNAAAEEMNADTLATGHNLDDMAQFIFSGYIYGNFESLARNSMINPPERGYKIKKVKPFFFTPENEILHYAILKGYPFIYDPCPYSSEFGSVAQERIGDMLKNMETKMPGMMINLVKTFEKQIRPALHNIYSKDEDVGKCKLCGRPTSNGRDICSFCSIKNKLIAAQLTNGL
ncbi:MAG: TIGR00269 family protein [Conexivisphaerales archaeon]